MSQEKDFLHYGAPTKYNKEPQGTIWLSSKNDDETIIRYIQISEDKENPRWEKIGTFLEVALGDMINDPHYMKSCMMLFKGNENKEYVDINTESVNSSPL